MKMFSWYAISAFLLSLTLGHASTYAKTIVPFHQVVGISFDRRGAELNQAGHLTIPIVIDNPENTVLTNVSVGITIQRTSQYVMQDLYQERLPGVYSVAAKGTTGVTAQANLPKSLPIGPYVLVASLLNTDGTVLGTTTQALQNVLTFKGGLLLTSESLTINKVNGKNVIAATVFNSGPDTLAQPTLFYSPDSSPFSTATKQVLLPAQTFISKISQNLTIPVDPSLGTYVRLSLNAFENPQILKSGSLIFTHQKLQTPAPGNEINENDHNSTKLMAGISAGMIAIVGLCILLFRIRRTSKILTVVALLIATFNSVALPSGVNAATSNDSPGTWSQNFFSSYDRSTGTGYLDGQTSGAYIINWSHPLYSATPNPCMKYQGDSHWKCTSDGVSVSYDVVSGSGLIPCSQSTYFQSTKAQNYPINVLGGDTVMGKQPSDMNSPYGYLSYGHALIVCTTSSNVTIQATGQVGWHATYHSCPPASKSCADSEDGDTIYYPSPQFSVSVKPGQNLIPQLTMSATTLSPTYNDTSATLNFQSVNADYIMLDGTKIGNVNSILFTNTANNPPPGSSWTYTAKACTNANVCSSPDQQLTVTRDATPVSQPPVITSVNVTPNVWEGDQYNVAWSVQNTDSISVSSQQGTPGYSETFSPTSSSLNPTASSRPAIPSDALLTSNSFYSPHSFTVTASKKGFQSVSSSGSMTIYENPTASISVNGSTFYDDQDITLTFNTNFDTAFWDDNGGALTSLKKGTSSSTFSAGALSVGPHTFTITGKYSPPGIQPKSVVSSSSTATLKVPIMVVARPVPANQITRFCSGD